MAANCEVVITGVGVVSPIGIGNEAFWTSLFEGRSGVRRLDLFDQTDIEGLGLPPPFGADVADFDPKQYVRPRKSLKVMSREIQLAFAAADLACVDAGLPDRPIDPERLGIVFGADMLPCDLSELTPAFRGCLVEGEFDYDLWGKTSMAEMYPLWMLKYLPNMPACHIGIAQDARGPNNSLTLGEVSSLSAVAEGVRVIERGHADAIIAGGTGSRIIPGSWIRAEVLGVSYRDDDPTTIMCPFDARRDGTISGEGAGAFILERRSHAEARGARILARVLGFASTFESCPNGRPLQGRAIRSAIAGALADAGLAADAVGHVNAHGASTVLDDRIEARAIHDAMGDVPVTAPKSYFGNLAAGTGAVEMAASVLGLQQGLIPQTLNYRQPDPQCPVQVVRDRPMPTDRTTAMILNHVRSGQAVALLLEGCS
ncbi:MAG TPA: beta-ketoacyl-[acyl-carrier-protein] synthase family protein [Thermoguttaceae bacterium]|nr:beta-ketoacyl-[acyl-carrier-protein] synthase family protein [Thermoguttaceae bacterium]